MKITMKITMKIMGFVKVEHLCLRVKIYIKEWEWYIFQKKKETGVWQMVHLRRRKYWYENNRCLMNGTSSKKDAYEKDEWQMVHLPQIKMYKKKMGLMNGTSAWARRHDTATKAEVTVQSRDWLGAVIYFGRSHLYPVANFLESKILKNGLIKIGL